MRSYLETAHYSDWKTDSKEEIEYTLKALVIAEKKYPSVIPHINTLLASAYNDLHNFEKAAEHCRKALELLDANGDGRPENRANTYFQLAYAYYYLGKMDSSLHYGQLSNELYLKLHKSELQKVTSTVTADSYAQLGNDKLAEGYYNSSIEPNSAGRSFGDAMAAGHYSFYLLQHNRLSEAKYYGRRGLNAAIAAQAKSPLLENVSFLRRIYEAAHQSDSAYYFAKLELAYRDSLFNQDRLYAVQDLAFKEQVRQHEEKVKKAEEDVQRKHNLQYAFIALALVSFVIVFFLLSHSIIANQKLIRFLGIIALLITFEFVNLYIHPFLAHATNESPLLMLLVMVCIAALLVPLHHKLEHWITHKLVEKNNKIRLAAAKKTIERLEKNTDGQ
jgi:tetratricopeptide (TPR) repeat protein